MDFTGKTAVVTGAAKGIGRAVASILARHGANLALMDIDGAELEAFADELRTQGRDVLTAACSVADEEAVNEAVARAQARFGGLDILVNNAGIYRGNSTPFWKVDSAEWKRKIDINILGTMYCAKAVIPGMIERRCGRIINIGSVAGVYGIAGMTDYSMTKGAVIGFTHALAKELAEYNVLVNTVSPGNINASNVLPDYSFLNRSGSYDECANLICFLASDEASYITGQNYVIDGGRRKM